MFVMDVLCMLNRLCVYQIIVYLFSLLLWILSLSTFCGLLLYFPSVCFLSQSVVKANSEDQEYHIPLLVFFESDLSSPL